MVDLPDQPKDPAFLLARGFHSASALGAVGQVCANLVGGGAKLTVQDPLNLLFVEVDHAGPS